MSPEPEAQAVDASTDDVIPPVAEWIYREGSDSGFAGLRTDYPNRSLTVFWNGPVPASIKEYAESRPHGVAIEIVPGSAYSRLQLQEARERLIQNPLTRELGIVSISVNGDGSGLTLGSTHVRQLDDASIDQLAQIAEISDIAVNTGLDEPTGFGGV